MCPPEPLGGHIRQTALFRAVIKFLLDELVLSLVVECQLPPKIVNLLFTFTDQNIELTVWWGSWLSETY